MRFAFFSSCDSIRDTFDLEKLSEYKIPIPSIEKQKAIADIYKCYCNRNKINEALKQQIKNICSVLISGSMQYRG
ncbi:MAG: restriction endonuclease subunit S [Mycoplasmoidaceae bacterium]|nr:restriction endonuclease subunit S [Mycoplasmoidaceae bacterium]